MKINFPAFIIMLFFLSAVSGVGFVNADTVYFSIEKAIGVASKNDLKLIGLKLSLNDLLKSKINLYRSLLPDVKANASWQKVNGVGEADSSSYNVGLSIEELLYDQLSTPIKFKAYYNSIEKARLEIKNREREIEQQIINLYLTIIFGEKRLNNSEEKISIYEKLVSLVNVENRLGSKTIMDVVESEKRLLEARLDKEELAENIQVSYRDLINMLNLNPENIEIKIDRNMKGVLKKIIGNRSQKTPDTIEGFIKYIEKQFKAIDRDEINRKAIDSDFKLRELKVSLIGNSLKRKLLGILWLKNISVNCGVNFTGDRFFPVNKTYSIGATVLLDFGYLAPSISVSKSGLKNNKTESGSGESQLFDELKIINKRELLNMEAYSIKKEIEVRRKKIKRDIDVWFISYDSLVKKYKIFEKQKQIVDKNNEIIKVKRDIGEIKPVDYLQFEAEKREFELKMDELSRDFIKLSREFEKLSSIPITELTGLKK